MAIYHKLESCNKCKGENDIEVIANDNGDGLVCEAKTKCQTCGFIDYWAYGYFESGNEIISNCETYGEE